MKKIIQKRIDEIFDWIDDGIFKYLDEFDVCWKNKVDADLLDMDYFGNRSGSKSCSPLISKLLDENEELSVERKRKIAKLIFQKYGEDWSREWNAYFAEYNPIENYNSFEERTPELKTKRTPDLIEKINVDDDVKFTPGITEIDDTKSSSKEVVDNDIYGFNSTAASNKDKMTSTSPFDDNHTVETKTKSGLDETTTKTETEKTNKGTEEIEESGKETTIRKGNIGVTTSQQMIESELNLRINWNFFKNIVFVNIDEELTINKYL